MLNCIRKPSQVLGLTEQGYQLLCGLTCLFLVELAIMVACMKSTEDLILTEQDCRQPCDGVFLCWVEHADVTFGSRMKEKGALHYQVQQEEEAARQLADRYEEKMARSRQIVHQRQTLTSQLQKVRLSIAEQERLLKVSNTHGFSCILFSSQIGNFHYIVIASTSSRNYNCV